VLSPVATGGLLWAKSHQQSSKPAQIETWNTINQLSFWQLLECQAPHTNAKPPYWKLSGDGFACAPATTRLTPQVVGISTKIYNLSPYIRIQCV